jgi:hypothetical protein
MVLASMGMPASMVTPESIITPASTMGQSLSVALVFPGGQHMSPLIGMVTGLCEQARVHMDARPDAVSVVQGLLSSQLAGHDAAGSQVSPGSTTLLPQVAVQLGS